MTDFLAANNISAVQISADYERRQAEARQREAQETTERGGASTRHDRDGDEVNDNVESNVNKKKRKRQNEKAIANANARKNAKSKDKDLDDHSDEGDLGWDMYRKRKPLPGQLENCEECEKRFTVTPYSKTGGNGGLLCGKCSKEQEAFKKKSDNAKKPVGGREKRRQIQSKLLDGVVQIGSTSLQDLCIKVCHQHCWYVSRY